MNKFLISLLSNQRFIYQVLYGIRYRKRRDHPFGKVCPYTSVDMRRSAIDERFFITSGTLVSIAMTMSRFFYSELIRNKSG